MRQRLLYSLIQPRTFQGYSGRVLVYILFLGILLISSLPGNSQPFAAIKIKQIQFTSQRVPHMNLPVQNMMKY